MPDFRLPVGPASLLDGIDFLEVEFDGYGDPQLFKDASEALGDHSGGDLHAEFRTPIALGSSPAELTGLIGLHDFRALPDWSATDEEDSGIWLHYTLQIKRRPRRDEESTNWDVLSPVLARWLGQHEAAVDLRMILPLTNTVTAVTLPIELGEGAIAGFSQIRGVQLASVPNDDTQQPLYSVILQPTGNRMSVATWLDTEVELDANILDTAISKAATIARLAVPSLESV